MAVPGTTAAVYSVVAAPDSGVVVCRNGVVLKTPAGRWVAVPTEALGQAIADELRAHSGKPDPARLPLLTLASTARDIVAKSRDTIIDQIAAYAGSELLCHRAELPPELAEQQRKTWQPLLDWCAEAFGAPLRAASGIMPIGQPPESRAALRRAVEAYDDFRLAGLSQAVGVSGSLVLGLALATRHIDAEQAFAAAELDATHQIEKWGEDPAALARREAVRRDLAVCERWFGLL